MTFVNDTTGVITQATLTVSAAGINKTYDGTTDATVTLSDNRVAGDVLTTSYTAAAFTTDEHVGTGKAVSVSGIAISGADAPNYVLSGTTAGTTADITQRAITVTAATNTKVYDGDNSAAALPTITVGSLGSGDTVTWSQTYDNENVGTGKTLTPAGTVSDGNSGNNYAVTFVNDLTGVITQRPASVTPNPASKTYAQPDPIPLTTGTLSNFLAADGVTAVYSRTSGEAIGTYTISATLSPAGVLGNYNITYNTANFTITPVDNTPPTTTGIGDIEVAEDAANTIIDLFAAFEDAEDLDADLTYTIQSNSNAGLFTSVSIDDVAGMLTLDYAPDTTGTADITVRATDTGGLFVDTTFTVTVMAAEEQIDTIVGDIQDLVDQDALNPKDADKLIKNLDKASEKFAEGNNDKAVKELDKFVKNVEKLVDKGKLSAEDGQLLIDAANDAIASAPVSVPQENTQILITDVEALVDTAALSEKDADKLIKELDKAIKEFDKLRIDKGIENLGKFIDKVEKLVDKGKLSSQDGQLLIDAANGIIASAMPGSPLRASEVAGHDYVNQTIPSGGVLESLVARGKAYWASVGVEAGSFGLLDNVAIRITNLPGDYLGFASSTSIWIDQDGAGHGWFVDTASPSLLQIPTDKMDLLSVVTHELGHVLGFQHDASDSVMDAWLSQGSRPPINRPANLGWLYDFSPRSATFYPVGRWTDDTFLLSSSGTANDRALLSLLDEWAPSTTDRAISDTARGRVASDRRAKTAAKEIASRDSLFGSLVELGLDEYDDD